MKISKILHDQIKEYVLLMHGAPVMTVPLSEAELTLAVDTSFKAFEDYTGEKLTEDFEITQEVIQLFQRAALAYSKVILGKTNKRLMKEGKKEREQLKESFLAYIPTFMQKEQNMHENDEPITPSDTPKKGLLVIYINVGQLPPYKAEAFVERIKDKTDLKYTKQVCEVIYIPTRDRPTQVEYIAFGA